MAKDFRAENIQTSQLITSASNGTNAKMVMYDISGQDTSSPNQGIIDPTKFVTSSIGTDIFLYVSGGVGQKDSANSNAVSVFGGDVHISGNLSIDGTGGGTTGGINQFQVVMTVEVFS